jgi:hypothetical protein
VQGASSSGTLPQVASNSSKPMEDGDLNLTSWQPSLGEDKVVWRYQEEARKARVRQGCTRGIQQPGCAIIPKLKQPHISYVSVRIQLK